MGPNGEPVPYEKFRMYAYKIVDGLDKDPEAQEMILEQFIAEAQSGRDAFTIPALENESDLLFKQPQKSANMPSKKKLRVIAKPEKLVMEEPYCDACNWCSIFG